MAGAGGGGARGGAGKHKSLRNCGGGGKGSGGRIRDVEGAKRSNAGAVRGVTEAKETTATAMRGRKIATEDPPVRTHDDSAGGKYHVGGTGPENSADESAEWSGEETEESASEEESDTTGGLGEVGMTLTVRAEESEVSGAEDGPRGAAAGRGASLDATSEDVDTEGARGHHGAEKSERERVPGWQENLSGESYRVGDREGGPKASRVAENTGGIASVWEGGLSCRG